MKHFYTDYNRSPTIREVVIKHNLFMSSKNNIDNTWHLSELKTSVSDREVTPEAPGFCGTGTFSRFFAWEGTVDILQCRVKWQDKVVQETNHGTGIRPSDSWFVITCYI